VDINDLLGALGLNEKENRIYLACLKAGPASVTRIAELTRLPKSTCYDVLRSLISKGMCISVTQRKIMYFEATDPNSLITRLDEQRALIKGALPKLLAMRGMAAEKPRLELYVGKESLKTIYDEVIKTGKEFLVIGNQEKFAGMLEWFAPQFVRRRVKAAIKCRGIYERSSAGEELRARDKTEMRQTRFCDAMTTMDSECYTFGDKVVFITLSRAEPVGILVQSKDIARLQRMLFEQLWASTER
jgi:sugar-specific transcriptional regulator TrmB